MSENNTCHMLRDIKYIYFTFLRGQSLEMLGTSCTHAPCNYTSLQVNLALQDVIMTRNLGRAQLFIYFCALFESIIDRYGAMI